MASLIAANTHFCALLRTDRVSVHPVAMSVISSVKQNSPLLLPPSWPTRSISTNPGTASSHSAHVRIGIESFNSVPGLVCDRPSSVSFAQSALRRRSIVAGAICSSSVAVSSSTLSSPRRRSRGTRSGNAAASSRPHGVPCTAQRNRNALITASP